MNIIIFGPAWGTYALLELLVRFLKTLGHTVSIAPMYGHYGDHGSVQGASLQSYIQQAEEYFQKAVPSGQKAFLIGISLGSVISHHIANAFPQRVQGVVMYGSPMLGGLPKIMTVLRIICNRYYWPILRGKGSVSLTLTDCVYFLFGGIDLLDESNALLIDETAKQPESAGVLKDIMFGRIKPNGVSEIPYTVIYPSAEKFNDKEATRHFARKQGIRKGNFAEFVLLQGSHFGLLGHASLFFAVKQAIVRSQVRSEARENPVGYFIDSPYQIQTTA